LPRFIGSEFTRSDEEAARIFPIRSEDLSALSFPDGSFDLVSTNEVLEHVPSIDACLVEIARVLAPGGWHIGTVPFASSASQGEVRARVENGAIVHLTEPVYHGNPMLAEGSLVFEIPGWDIIERCRKAGFSSASMRFVMSQRHGCVTSDTGGVFVLCARK
jgi:SAM-dependent methyltransferase